MGQCNFIIPHSGFALKAITELNYTFPDRDICGLHVIQGLCLKFNGVLILITLKDRYCYLDAKSMHQTEHALLIQINIMICTTSTIGLVLTQVKVITTSCTASKDDFVFASSLRISAWSNFVCC